MLGVCIAALGGCRHGAAVQATAGRDSPACDFTTQLDRWLAGVRGRFGEQGFYPMFDEFKTHFKVVHTDNRMFFSYRAECFRYTGNAGLDACGGFLRVYGLEAGGKAEWLKILGRFE